jgi:uncharacterized protein YukE
LIAYRLAACGKAAARVAVMATSRFELSADGLRAAQVCLGQRVPAGDPAGIRLVAVRSGARAAALRRTASALLSGAEAGLWRGAAHRAFEDQLRTHAPSMSATADRYEHYAAALSSYAGALEETAPRLGATRRLLQQGCAELSRRQHAAVVPGVAEYQSSPDPGSDLLPIARDFKAAYDRWADALDRCIRALSDADQADPTRDVHGFRAFEHRVATVAHHSVSPFEQAMLHPSLHTLSDCLGALNVDLTALGVALLFICPPAGTACLAAATVLAVTRLAVDSTRRARGEQVSTAGLGFELAAAIPIGGSAVRGVRAAEDVVHLVPGGGLLAHEGVEGGHTLAKHVGKTEEFLRNRLATEPDITGASTFYNREVAENSIAEVLKAHAKSIRRWLAGAEGKLIIMGSASQVCGLVLRRPEGDPIESAAVRAVLRRSDALGLGYRIHTAMVMP